MVFTDVWHVTRADSADKSSHALKVMLASHKPVTGPQAEIQTRPRAGWLSSSSCEKTKKNGAINSGLARLAAESVSQEFNLVRSFAPFLRKLPGVQAPCYVPGVFLTYNAALQHNECNPQDAVSWRSS